MSRHLVCAAACALLLAAASHAELSIGDTVTLVVRDANVPAHPGDGDHHLSVRFESGTEATIEAIGNWIKVRGTIVGGGTASGWILARYIDSAGSPQETTFPELRWCPDKGSPDPHPSGNPA